MASLVLTEPGTELGVEGELFVVRRGAVVVRRVRIQDVGQVLLMGPIGLTSAAIAIGLRKGIDIVFLTGAGRYRGRLVGPPSRNAPLRLAQFRVALDAEAPLAIARGMVQAKVQNQRNLLLRVQRRLRDEAVAEAAAGMRLLQPKIESASGLDTLRGLEGQAAALYFGVFGRTIRNPAFTFTRRTRRPPTDAVNACLSFGYTLLGIAAEGLVLGAGLDPLVGFFHQADYGRPSLVLDVIEEFRPLVVDSLVLRLVNRRQVGPEDFEHPRPRGCEADALLALAPDDTGNDEAGEEAATPEAVYLADSGRRVFLSAFFRRLRESLYYPPRGGTYEVRGIIEQQVYALARVIQGKERAYVGFVPR